jgi:hypothetical protein
MSQRLAAVRFITGDRDAAKKAAAIHTPLARGNAELPCRQFGSTERLWPRADLIPQLQKSAFQRGWANSATSLKQAVFGHLREF